MIAAEKASGRWERFVVALRSHFVAISFVTAVVILAALTASAISSPTTTLSYIRVLRWPLAAVTLLFFFRRSITSLIDRIEHGKLNTPFGGGEFDARAGEPPTAAGQGSPAPLGESADSTAEADFGSGRRLRNSDLAGKPESQELDPDVAVEQLTAYNRELTQQLNRYYLLATIYGAQINLLNWLKSAPEGAPIDAVAAWFRQLQATNEAWARVNLPTLTDWLLRTQLIEIGSNGNYRLTQGGVEFVDFLDGAHYAQKAF